MYFANISYQGENGSSSHSLGVVFCRADIFNINEIQPLNYFFNGSCFWCYTASDFWLQLYFLPSLTYSPVMSTDFYCELCCEHWELRESNTDKGVVLMELIYQGRDRPWTHWQANERISENISAMRPGKQKYSLTRDIRQCAQARPYCRDEIWADKR